jgi:hypothetical protein
MWTQQKGLIPVMFLAFAAYFLWDGFFGYPRSDARWTAHERWKKFEELKTKPEEWAKVCAANGWKTDAPDSWEKICTEHGWTTTPPEKFLGPAKYAEQFWFGGGTGLIGLIALIYWNRVRRSVVRSDGDGVQTPSGRRVPYAAITRVDKRLWKSKGFATIHHTDGGTAGKFTLDDAKHDPKALDTILADIIANTSGTAAVQEE